MKHIKCTQNTKEFFNNQFRHIFPTSCEKAILWFFFFLHFDSLIFLKSWSSCNLFLWAPLSLEESARSTLRTASVGLLLNYTTNMVVSQLWNVKIQLKRYFGFFQEAQIVNSNFVWIISDVDCCLAWKPEELASKFAIFTQPQFWWSSQTMTFFFFPKKIAFYSLWP